jgi:hypothetical protein
MIPDKMIPMAYLVLAIAAAVALKYAGISGEVPGMIIGAALTRVKMPAPDSKEVTK